MKYKGFSFIVIHITIIQDPNYLILFGSHLDLKKDEL